MFIRRYLIFVALISFIFLVLYFVVEVLDVPILTNPTPLLSVPSVGAAFASVALLTLDVILPVPSSLVMVVNGALFGIYIGALLSLIGRLGAFIFGYYLGVKAFSFARKFIREEEMGSANSLLKRWGFLAIILTRPIPIISETMAIMAGVSSMSFRRSLIAATLGNLPEAFLFALTGAVSASFNNTALMFVAILFVTGVFWIVSKR